MASPSTSPASLPSDISLRDGDMSLSIESLAISMPGEAESITTESIQDSEGAIHTPTSDDSVDALSEIDAPEDMGDDSPTAGTEAAHVSDGDLAGAHHDEKEHAAGHDEQEHSADHVDEKAHTSEKTNEEPKNMPRIDGPPHRNFCDSLAEWARENPRQAAALGISTAVIVAPMAFAAPVLGLIGFGAPGVAGASMAAAWQSTIGNVAAGSLFAILQSAGAGGAVGTAVVGTTVGAGGVAGVAATARSFFEWRRRGNQEGPR